MKTINFSFLFLAILASMSACMLDVNEGDLAADQFEVLTEQPTDVDPTEETSIFQFIGPENTPVFRIYNPVFNGRAIDYCLVNANLCGTPAATVACKLYGYRVAESFGVNWDSGNTYVLGTDYHCDQSSCDSFRYIDCEESL